MGMADCPCNYLPRLATYVILIHQRHRRTDTQTERGTDVRTDDMQSQDRAVHYSASRGKNSNIKYTNYSYYNLAIMSSKKVLFMTQVYN